MTDRAKHGPRRRGSCSHIGGCRKPANVIIDDVPYCPRHATVILLAVYDVWVTPNGKIVEEHGRK